ncbi:hypothetical protein LDENG_00129160 [Lucifuga dentata]|nr:hypothetical protein LDENG_00129160 [Lucifuga dentata]
MFPLELHKHTTFIQPVSQGPHSTHNDRLKKRFTSSFPHSPFGSIPASLHLLFSSARIWSFYPGVLASRVQSAVLRKTPGKTLQSPSTDFRTNR